MVLTGDRYITARVVDTTSSTIVVADAGGALAPVYVALNGQTQGFVVYDFHTGDNTTGGTWTEGPGYNSMLGLTRFTNSTASFAAFMLGWTVILDVEKPSFLTIFGVPPGGLSVEVRGDATGLGAGGGTYRVIAPPGVDPTTGALSNGVPCPSRVRGRDTDSHSDWHIKRGRVTSVGQTLDGVTQYATALQTRRLSDYSVSLCIDGKLLKTCCGKSIFTTK